MKAVRLSRTAPVTANPPRPVTRSQSPGHELAGIWHAGNTGQRISVMYNSADLEFTF